MMYFQFGMFTSSSSSISDDSMDKLWLLLCDIWARQPECSVWAGGRATGPGPTPPKPDLPSVLQIGATFGIWGNLAVGSCEPAGTSGGFDNWRAYTASLLVLGQKVLKLIQLIGGYTLYV